MFESQGFVLTPQTSHIDPMSIRHGLVTALDCQLFLPPVRRLFGLTVLTSSTSSSSSNSVGKAKRISQRLVEDLLAKGSVPWEVCASLSTSRKMLLAKGNLSKTSGAHGTPLAPANSPAASAVLSPASRSA